MVKISNWFEKLLLEIIFRIARHWGCDVYISKAKLSNGDVKWIKLVFNEPTRRGKGR